MAVHTSCLLIIMRTVDRERQILT